MGIHIIEPLHHAVGEFDIPGLKILLNPPLIRRFGDHTCSSLNRPGDKNLRGRTSGFIGDLPDDLIFK